MLEALNGSYIILINVSQSIMDQLKLQEPKAGEKTPQVEKVPFSCSFLLLVQIKIQNNMSYIV